MGVNLGKTGDSLRLSQKAKDLALLVSALEDIARGYEVDGNVRYIEGELLAGLPFSLYDLFTPKFVADYCEGKYSK